MDSVTSSSSVAGIHRNIPKKKATTISQKRKVAKKKLITEGQNNFEAMHEIKSGALETSASSSSNIVGSTASFHKKISVENDARSLTDNEVISYCEPSTSVCNGSIAHATELMADGMTRPLPLEDSSLVTCATVSRTVQLNETADPIIIPSTTQLNTALTLIKSESDQKTRDTSEKKKRRMRKQKLPTKEDVMTTNLATTNSKSFGRDRLLASDRLQAMFPEGQANCNELQWTFHEYGDERVPRRTKKQILASKLLEKKQQKEKKVINCRLCGSVTKFDHRREHIYEHLNVPHLFQCSLCAFQHTSDVSVVRIHVESVHNEKGVVVSRTAEFNKEINRLHNQAFPHPNSKVKCSKCLCTVSPKAQLQKVHVISKHMEEPYECAVCNKTFGIESSILMHLQVSHNLTKDFIIRRPPLIRNNYEKLILECFGADSNIVPLKIGHHPLMEQEEFNRTMESLDTLEWLKEEVEELRFGSSHELP